tara:strand:- start:3309 stop:3998 length:690 start_codon:yes stop_codon:yes gene_type:complete
MAYPLSERMAGAFNKKPGGSYPFVFGPGFPGIDLGNAGSFSGQGNTPQLKTKAQQDIERIGGLIPAELQSDYQLFTGQGGDPNKYNVQERMSALRQSQLDDLNLKTQQAEYNKLIAPPTADPANPLDAAVGRYLDKLPTQPSFADIRGALKEDAEYRQKLAKDSAKTAFQYEMMGRIPDTIMAGLAGSGRLMREGARDISNTVMRGVEALPKPNIQARAYQNPTFRYFQ